MKDISAALARFPRTRLLHLPTPLDPMARLGAQLGLKNLTIKRDDCTGAAGGGNKTRKLEYEIGKALSEGADTLITTGAIQSNHARQTAGLAAKLGLKCHLVLQHAVADPTDEYLSSGNMLLDKMFGATIYEMPVPKPPRPGSNEPKDSISAMTDAAAMERVANDVRAADGKPYIVCLGASSAIGALGYAECAAELAQQAQVSGGPLDWVVLANGTSGTQAGLVAGFKAMGVDTKVLGVGVSGTSQDGRAKLVNSIAQATLQLLGSSQSIEDNDVILTGDYVGTGYGEFDKDVRDAVFDIAGTEGILIDPVYTGKALAGLIDMARAGKFDPNARIAYLHSGGWPGLFAYTSQLS